MGEYAMFGGERVKIGTCEDMYYLRADQRHMVQPLGGNVDPERDAGEIRFRFPWPDEDGIEPGAFERYDRTVRLYGVEVPEGVEHGHVQFVASAGFNVCLPCPESDDGKAFARREGLTVHRNGYPGPVQFGQTAWRRGLWVLVARCGGCHYPYRYPTLAEVEPIVVAVRSLADRREREDKGGGAWYHTVADRILAGYVSPSCAEVRP